MDPSPSSHPPRSVVVVGAGIVGLSCAWFLQRAGVEVVVLERRSVAAGASAGNAGWISPGFAGPLVSREALRHGLRGVWDRRGPVVVAPGTALRSVRFLLGFARNARSDRAHRAQAALDPLNREALDAFDALAAGGVPLRFGSTPILAALPDEPSAVALIEELAPRIAAGALELEGLDGDALRSLEPSLRSTAATGLRIRGQRWLDPLAATTALASGVERLGGRLVAGVQVDAVRSDGLRPQVVAGDRSWSADAVVIATGVWADRWRRQLGVRLPVRAGRGYSVRVRPRTPLRHALYLPTVRLACTPQEEHLRVTGIMELAPPDARPRAARIRTILAAVRRFVDLEDDAIASPWVGPRPLSPDGLPLVGPTAVPGVYLAAGHGMWGVTLGPATGRLLACELLEGAVPEPLRPLRPSRSVVSSRRSAA